MFDNKNENTILFVIKYIPPIFIISLSIIISIVLFFHNEKIIQEEQNKIRNEYILKNKELIKEQIERVYAFINSQHSKTKELLKENLKQKVYEAHDIAMNIYNENKHLGQKQVTKMIKDALRNIRFNNGRGYFFIYSFDYECILLPVAKQLEGNSFYNFKDGKGSYLTRNIVEQVKKDDEGFLTWWYHKPNDMKKQYKKLGFNKKFEPYNWFIGTGEYIHDFEEDIKKKTLDQINDFKYKSDEYIFILDYEGNYLSHIRKNIIGLNALKNSHNIDFKVIHELINIGKEKGSAYYTYLQKRRPTTNLPAIKTSYIKDLNTWKWIIGKGFYENDIEKEIKRETELINKRLKDKLNDLFIITIVMTFVIVIISVYFSKQIEKMFKKYKEEINKQQHILAQQSKMAAIGTMIGNIAHQWRQPLNLISTASTSISLKRDLGQLKDEDLTESLNYINKSTQYLSKTIDDFRNFFLSNKEKEEFYVDDAITKALDIVSVQYQNKKIEIVKNIEKVKMYSIESELVQVIINILNNAKDELIKVDDKKRVILIDVITKNDLIKIMIKDSAGGVPKDIIEHVFEPYFTTKHQSQGTGIGLYMSKEIVDKHLNGSISISNKSYKYKNSNFIGAEVTLIFDTYN